jgi:predicted transposase/invertase (TIGR01784 family)
MITSEWSMDIALEVRGEERALEKALKIARNLKAKGMSVNEIAEATELTVDEILRL